MDLSNTVITTKRLRLVPISEQYAADIFKEFTEEITLYMSSKAPEKIEETVEWIRSRVPSIKNGTDFPVVVLDKETGEYLGGAGAHQLDTDTPSLGIWIKKSAHGHHYGREAVTALKEWIDTYRNDYSYISYPVDKRNISSQKIAQSLGGIIEDAYQKESKSGRVLDLVEYRIYREKK